MDTLPTEILYKILLNLDIDFLVSKCLLVSKTWRNEIKRRSFIKNYCENNIKNFPDFKERNISPLEHIIYLRIMSLIGCKDYIAIGSLGASSTDRMVQHPVLTISRHPYAFWSSIGTENKDTNEFLIYKILFDVSIISEIKIRFLKANWIDKSDSLHGHPCFVSDSIKIKIINDKNEIIYTSKIFEIEHNDSMQTFQIEPVFITKDHKIYIYFLGKKELQIDDNKYYICVKTVEIHGITGISLPYEYDGTKFSFINRERLAQNFKKIITLKHQLFSVTDFIVKNQNIIGRENTLQRYLDNFGRGEILEIPNE